MSKFRIRTFVDGLMLVKVIVFIALLGITIYLVVNS